MKALAATVRLDLQLQARSGLYSIGMAVAVMLGLAARYFFSVSNAGVVVASFFLLGTGGTTYFFSAALVLMEKSQGTLMALRTSPLGARSYIASKVITLVGFACVESVTVWVVGFAGRGVPLDPLPLVSGLVVLSVFQTLVGLGQVAPHTSITAFLIPDAVLVGGVLQLPALYVLGVGPSMLWHAIPSQAPFLMMLGASRALTTLQWGYALTVSFAMLIAAAWWASWRFRKHIRFAAGSFR